MQNETQCQDILNLNSPATPPKEVVLNYWGSRPHKKERSQNVTDMNFTRSTLTGDHGHEKDMYDTVSYYNMTKRSDI